LVTFDGIAKACALAMGAPEPELVHFNAKDFDFGKAKAFPMRDQHFFTSIDKVRRILFETQHETLNPAFRVCGQHFCTSIDNNPWPQRRPGRRAGARAGALPGAPRSGPEARGWAPAAARGVDISSRGGRGQ
jgi:hypothetical protein